MPFPNSFRLQRRWAVASLLLALLPAGAQAQDWPNRPLNMIVPAAAGDVAETMLSVITVNRFVTDEVVVIDGGFTSST